MKKRIIRMFSLLIVMVCLLQQAAGAYPYAVTKYNTYTPSPWAQEAVIHLKHYGIIPEEDVPQPDLTAMSGFRWSIRRDVIAYLFVNLYEYRYDTQVPIPEDYPLDPWKYNGFEESVKKAYGLGLMKGRSATEFGYSHLTRQEFSVVLYRAAKAMDGFKGEAESYSPQDAGEIADWAIDAVSYMYHEGILVGTSDDTFSPNDSVTKEMAYTAIHRLALANGIYAKLPESHIDSADFLERKSFGDIDRLYAECSEEEAQVIRRAFELFPTAYEVHAYTADMEHGVYERTILLPGAPDTKNGEYGRLIINATEGDFALILTQNGIFCTMKFSSEGLDDYEELLSEVSKIGKYPEAFAEKYERVKQRAWEADDKQAYENGYFGSTVAYISVDFDMLFDGICVGINEIYPG